MATDAFTIRSSALPDDARVYSFEGTEALARPYRFDVFVRVPHGDDLDLAGAVDAKVTLTMQETSGETPLVWHGVVSSAKLVHQAGENCLVRVTMVPPVWMLGLSRHSRVFTRKTIPEILESILQDGGLTSSDYELRLTGSYDQEEHVCQYQESDLDFLHRWMEFEGIYYFFEHDDERVVMVITDAAPSHVALSESPVRYHPTSGDDGSADACFDRFHCEHLVRPAAVRVSDYDYANPTLDLSARASVSSVGTGEVSVHAGRTFTPSAAARIAKIRKEELAVRAAVSTAVGSARYQRVGYLFTLEDHPLDALNRAYLVIEAEHYGYAGGGGALDQLVHPKWQAPYRVRLSAIASNVQFRPRRTTRWPRVWGFDLATIDGPAESDYAQINDQGCYAVKFFFDESALKDGAASTWIRMQQPHGGAIEGFHFPLRKGTEVMITFQGGDPDRPIIAGVVPTATTASPVTSANNTKNIIQTGGRNRVEIEDQDGSQRVTMFSPTQSTFLRLGAPNDDFNFILQSDGVGNIFVGGQSHWTTGGNKDETVDDAITEVFTGPFSTTVTEGAVTETYKGKKTETVHETITEFFGSTLDVTVTGPVTEAYGSHKTHVTKLREETLKGKVTQTYGDKFDRYVTGPVVEEFGDAYEQNVTGAYTLTVHGDLKEDFAKYEEKSASWFRMNKGLEMSKTGGFTFAIMGGCKNENTVGLKKETTAGMKFDFTIAARIGVNASVKLEKVGKNEQANFGAAFKSYGAYLKTVPRQTYTKAVDSITAGIHFFFP